MREQTGVTLSAEAVRYWRERKAYRLDPAARASGIRRRMVASCEQGERLFPRVVVLATHAKRGKIIDPAAQAVDHVKMDSPLPRVSIAVPSGDMVHADFAMAYAQLCMASAGLQLQLITVKSSIVAQARNDGVAIARNFGADYIFFIDSDMLFPPTSLFRLLLHRRDIVGATYTKRVAPFEILGTKLAEQPIVSPDQLVEMQRIPTGCLLINMRVFDKLSKPHFRFEIDANGAIVGEDYVFCDRAREAGFRIWCDAVMSREIGHIGQSVYRLPSALAGVSEADLSIHPEPRTAPPQDAICP
jgi:glycosyltransferase involved in cell wall biosynthesis